MEKKNEKQRTKRFIPAAQYLQIAGMAIANLLKPVSQKPQAGHLGTNRKSYRDWSSRSPYAVVCIGKTRGRKAQECQG